MSYENHWALILGASSGMGEATSLELARAGLNIFGVHLDRKATLPNVERITGEIEGLGRKAVFFNINAADAEKRADALATMTEHCEQTGTGIQILMHSLAFGTLRKLITDDPKDALNQKQLEMTLDVMANSVVYWVQDALHAGLLRKGAHVFGMTSAGDFRHWATYGAVSAAKCALESYLRQLASELAPRGIACNALRAGVTDTPALRKIPGHEEMVEQARTLNPGGRLTVPQDVAEAIRAIGLHGTTWITGNVINVDGGEANA